MLTRVTMEQTIAILQDQAVSLRQERIPLASADRRILAEDLLAVLNLPAFRKSPFDGYACRAEDVPGVLRVVGTSTAGTEALMDIQPGEAIRIFTGAPVPMSANTVIKQENVSRMGTFIEVFADASAARNVIQVGEDVREGALLIAGGTRLQPAHLGMLAGQGVDSVTVFSRPKALLLPTGSELVEPGDQRPLYGIYNSSSYVLSAYLKRMGFEVRRTTVIPDELEAVRQSVLEAVTSDADVVFTTGGASVGDYDFAAHTARDLSAETLFWKVKMKPGGALLVSQLREKLLISLSGNPAAALMSLLVVLHPYPMKLLGTEDRTEEILLPLKYDMPKTSDALRLLRGHLDFAEGTVCFAEHEGRGNGNIASFTGCELIGLVPGGNGPLKKGDLIHALRLPPELC